LAAGRGDGQRALAENPAVHVAEIRRDAERELERQTPTPEGNPQS
jgi:hypothetical protein